MVTKISQFQHKIGYNSVIANFVNSASIGDMTKILAPIITHDYVNDCSFVLSVEWKGIQQQCMPLQILPEFY